jgi:MFS family permease
VSAPATRWWILAFISLALYGNYYVYDSIAPVADLLQKALGFSDTQIGTLNAIYSVPNIFLVLVGGVLADRFGAARVSVATAAICFAGALVTVTANGFVAMAAGRLLFGIGAETLIVATMIPLARWFSGRTVAFAMAISVSLARLGSYTADLSPTFFAPAYESGWRPALWIAVVMAGLSLAGAIGYALAERGRRPAGHTPAPAEPRFAWRDALRFDRSYWYVVALCVLFYSCIFPFRSTFSIMFFQHSGAMTLAQAGELNGNVFLAAVFATPLFGWLSDRYGYRALSLALGAAILATSFVVLALAQGQFLLSTVLLGIAFSLVPAVLWPAVSYLSPPQRLGTAFGLMTMLQNIGMAATNVAVGAINDQAGAGADHPAGYLPMLWFFSALASAGFVFAFLLWRRELGPQGHGMEGVRPAEG